MPRPEESMFRPTVVAAPPAAQPPLWRFPGIRAVGEGFVDLGDVEVGEPLPDDFVLRELLDLDVASDVALCRLTARYGCFTSYVVRPGDPFRFLPESERNLVLDQDVILAGDHFAAREKLNPRYIESLFAMREHARAARAMARHLLAHLEGGDVRAAWTAEGFNRPRSVGGAWSWWQDYMNAALAPFRMYVHVDRSDDKAGRVGLSEPTLYNACALQMAQLLAGEARVLHCANERCGRPFTRQRTSAARRKNADQFHLSGVLYCSRDCLKAKSERERRQRRKAESA